MNEISEVVKNTAYEILQDARIIKNENFNFNDAENMDSVNRVNILTKLEDEFNFIFKLKEISSWNTVLELVEIISKKLS